MTPEDDDSTRLDPQTAPASAAPKVPASAAASQVDEHGNGLPIGTALGEFEILSLLGEGGFGIVYLAFDRSLQRNVALKEYMPSSLAARSGASGVQVKAERYRGTFDAGLKSFVNEARLLAQFDHPALVKVYRFWEDNGTAYMVMPYYEGDTLRAMLRALPGPPDEAWLRALLSPLTGALAVIHAEQCYHRDIAPDNVMMLGGDHNRPLLLDFGAARRVIGDMTQALTVILKPGYAPVEQYAEIPGMKQGPWTDVYALAAVVYFAILGKKPPPSVGRLLNDTYEPLAQHAAGRYSEGFLAAVDRALAVRPEDRTQNIAEFCADLGLSQAQFDAYGGRTLSANEAPTVRVTSAPSFQGASLQRPSEPLAPASLADAATPRPTPTPAAMAPSRGIPPVGWAVLGVGALAALAIGAYTVLTPAPAIRNDDAGQGAPAVAAPLDQAGPTLPTPPTVAPVAPSPAFSIATEFDGVVRASTPGFNLRAETAKPALRIGVDQLTFKVQSDRDGFLYVLAYGSDQTLFQLYPNTESGSIRVKAGETLSLPKGAIVFDVTEPPGPGRLLLVVSARQRDHSALNPRTEGAFRSFSTGEEMARAVQAHQGPLPLLAGKVVCPQGQQCKDEFGAAQVVMDIVR